MTIRGRGARPPLDRSMVSTTVGDEERADMSPSFEGAPMNAASARSRADNARGGDGSGRPGVDDLEVEGARGTGVSRARSSAFACRFSHTKSSGGSWIASRGTFRNVFAIVDKVARRSAGSGTVGAVGVRRGDGAPTGATWRPVVTTTGAGRGAAGGAGRWGGSV